MTFETRKNHSSTMKKNPYEFFFFRFLFNLKTKKKTAEHHINKCNYGDGFFCFSQSRQICLKDRQTQQKKNKSKFKYSQKMNESKIFIKNNNEYITRN